jgi:hypothetical protein
MPASIKTGKRSSARGAGGESTSPLLLGVTLDKKKKFYYGGQAVIEGVMIRGKEGVAISVRQPNGQLNVVKQPLASIYKGRLRETPFIRGIIVLIETLALGTQSLLHSAQVAAAEEGEEKMLPADSILPVGFLPNTVLYESLKGKVPELCSSGDAVKPGIVYEYIS